jgi:hypothetical protein
MPGHTVEGTPPTCLCEHQAELGCVVGRDGGREPGRAATADRRGGGTQDFMLARNVPGSNGICTTRSRIAIEREQWRRHPD